MHDKYHHTHMKGKINGNTYDTATESKIPEAARAEYKDFTSVLYRTPDGLFFVVQEMYNYCREGRIGGQIICPLTAEEALEWLGQRADMPIKIYQMERPGPYEASYHDEVLRWLRGERNEIRPGSVGESWAEIAKDLVTKDPGLLKSSYRLRKAIGAVVEHQTIKCGLYDED